MRVAREWWPSIGRVEGLNKFCSLFREPVDNLSPEERDARTVFCMQLAARIRPRDLEDFFSAVGKVTFSVYFWVSHILSIPLYSQLRISLLPWIGSWCTYHLRSELTSFQGYCLCGILWNPVRTTGHWADWAEAARGAYHCTGLTGEQAKKLTWEDGVEGRRCGTWAIISSFPRLRKTDWQPWPATFRKALVDQCASMWAPCILISPKTCSGASLNPLAKWVESEGNLWRELEKMGKTSVPLCSVWPW